MLVCFDVATAPPAATLTIPTDEAWTDTGLDVSEGEPIHIEAAGTSHMVGMRIWDWFVGSRVDRRTGPQGTYVWPGHYRRAHPSRGSGFPLPTMAEGPFPAFCLIGKIGEYGAPFYVGTHYDGAASSTGRLWLGINDDHPHDNQGSFHVSITFTTSPTPSSALLQVEPESRAGHPLPGARVLLLYVDGLRLDVLQEMAQGGFLPHFQRLFLDQGLIVPNAFSVFPSNTLIANGSLFTGYFSDRTGIKSQNQFERATLKMRGQLSAYLPDGFIPKPKNRVLNLLDKYAPENTHAFLVKRGVPTLATRLGTAYRYTTLPIVPSNPPSQWFHRATNVLSPFGLSTRLPSRLDRVNAEYAIEEMFGDPEARVFAVWFPMVDKTSHHSRRGQFGLARRDLALADQYLGNMLDRLHELRWDQSMYYILVSDHGHLGGERTSNRTCNLPRDWAHRQLGCNINVGEQEWLHPGIDEKRFLFFDNQGSGQAALFLPYGSYFTGPWRRNRLYELTHYQIRPGQVMNLIESLSTFRPPTWREGESSPIDLILVKIDDARVFLYKDEERQALMTRVQGISGQELYRYQPVRALWQSEDGQLHYEAAAPRMDPLGYLQDQGFLSVVKDPAWFDTPHAAKEWLVATAHSRYPDAVVTMTKFFAWQSAVKDLAEVRDPDLLVSAAEGWSFRSDDGEGTDHGYPLADSMRITLVLGGPGIPAGVMLTPQRIVNVLPTILEMIRWPYNPQALDGQAIYGIYE